MVLKVHPNTNPCTMDKIEPSDIAALMPKVLNAVRDVMHVHRALARRTQIFADFMETIRCADVLYDIQAGRDETAVDHQTRVLELLRLRQLFQMPEAGAAAVPNQALLRSFNSGCDALRGG